MPDPLASVRPGDPLPRSAAAWNAILAAARVNQARQFDGGGRSLVQTRQGAIVRVANGTGVDLGRAAVVGLGAPIFTPADDLDAFLREPTFRAVVPTADAGKFGVLLGPVPDGAVGRAYVAGVCPVMVDVTDAGHKCCEVAAGDTSALASAADGSAQMVWREGGLGVQWAHVRINPACAPHSSGTTTVSAIPCGCAAVPSVLYIHTFGSPPGFAPATLTYQTTPPDLLGYSFAAGSAWFSPPFAAGTRYYFAFRYAFRCVSSKFVLAILPLIGEPIFDTFFVDEWVIPIRLNRCSPFHLENGTPSPWLFDQQGDYISQS